MTHHLGHPTRSHASFPSSGRLWLIYNVTLIVVVLTLLPNWTNLLHRSFLAGANLAGTLANDRFLLGSLAQKILRFGSLHI